MKFLVPNYSCLQNPWLVGYRPQIPILSALCPQLNLLNPPPEQNSWVRHWFTHNGDDTHIRVLTADLKIQVTLRHWRGSWRRFDSSWCFNFRLDWTFPDRSSDLCDWVALHFIFSVSNSSLFFMYFHFQFQYGFEIPLSGWYCTWGTFLRRVSPYL